MVFTPTEQPVQRGGNEPSELLIKEARDASRRRRLTWGATFIVAVLVAALVLAPALGRSKPRAPLANEGPGGQARTLVACTPSATASSNGPLVSEATPEEAHLLAITNTGSSSCLMSGYARIVVYGPTGAVIPFPLVHHATGGYALTSKPPKPFALAPHHSAYVLFAQVACAAGTETTASKIALYLPEASRASKVLTLLRPIAHCVGPSASYANPIAISPLEAPIAATEDYRS